jgi:hypothetical protein
VDERIPRVKGDNVEEDFDRTSVYVSGFLDGAESEKQRINKIISEVEEYFYSKDTPIYHEAMFDSIKNKINTQFEARR